MPRKKTVEVEEESTPVYIEDTSDVDGVLEQVGATSKYVAIKRQNPVTKEEEYVGRYDLPIENLLDRVKEDHGGGKYTGRICGQGGVYIKHVTFSIDSRFRPAPGVPPPTPVVAPVSPPSEGLSEVKDLLKQLIALQMAPKHDPFDVFIKAAELFKEKPSAVAPTPQPTSFSEMFSIFKQGMELGQQASGGEGLGYLPVIEKLGGPLVEALGKVVNRPPNPVVEKATNGVKAMEAPKPTNPEQYVKVYLPQIIGLAAKKKDPAFYADFVLDQIPESAHEFLLSVAQREDVIPYLSSLHPGVKEHEAWFLEFVKAIKEAYEPEHEEQFPEAFAEGASEPSSLGMESDE